VVGSVRSQTPVPYNEQPIPLEQAPTEQAGPVARAAPPPLAEFAPIAPFTPVRSYLDVYTGVTYTDNVERALGDNRRSDAIVMAGTELNIHRQDRELQLNAVGDLEYVKFVPAVYNGRAVGNLDGTAQWGRETDWFNWTLRDTFGQLSTDPQATANSANLDNVNYVSTGPTFNIPLGSLMRMSLYGTYSNVTYEKTRLYDYNAYLGGASLNRQLSEISTLAVVGEYQSTHFADTANYAQFSLRRFFVRYSIDGVRTRIRIEVGHQAIRDIHTSGGSLYIDTKLARRISMASSVYIRAADSYSAAGDLLQAQAGSSMTPTLPGQASNVASGVPFHERTYAVGWSFNKPRTTLSLEVSRIRDAYEQRATLDNATTSIVGDFTRRLMPTLSLDLMARFDVVNYTVIGKYNTRQLTAALTQSFGHLALSLQYDNFNQTSSTASLAYKENRIRARLIYGIGSAALGTGGPAASGGAGRALY
jgi:hypothetical protein